MPATFILSLPLEELDFELCLFCGQVFRFERTPTGFIGIDGPNRFTITKTHSPTEWSIEGDKSAFDRLFRFDHPLAEIHQGLTQADPAMEQIIPRVPGLRTMRPSSPSETFFCFLCSSNNNILRITQMIAKLSAFGEVGRFPAPEAIAEIGETRLRELGFGYRAASISQAAARLSREPQLLDQLHRAPYEDAFAELLTFHGVGPKLADCIALYSLDHTEAVPVDTHMWQAFTRAYRPDLAHLHPSEKRMREVGQFMRDRFGTLAGFAQHYLFVDNLKRSKA